MKACLMAIMLFSIGNTALSADRNKLRDSDILIKEIYQVNRLVEIDYSACLNDLQDMGLDEQVQFCRLDTETELLSEGEEMVQTPGELTFSGEVVYINTVNSHPYDFTIFFSKQNRSTAIKTIKEMQRENYKAKFRINVTK